LGGERWPGGVVPPRDEVHEEHGHDAAPGEHGGRVDHCLDPVRA